MTLIIALTNNITLLLALLFIYNLLKSHILCLKSPQNQFIQGVIFGLFALIAMMIPFQLAPGLVFDGRGIILSIASLFGGVIPGFITAIFIILYRLTLGGVGAPLAVGSAITMVTAGLLLRYLLARYERRVSAPSLVLLGLIQAVVLIFWLSLAPLPLRQQVMGVVAPPIFILYPGGILLAGLLFQFMERQASMAEALRKSEERYRTVVTSMSDGVIIRYADGTPGTMNPQAARLVGPVADMLLNLTKLPAGWRIIHEDGTRARKEDLPSVIAIQTGEAKQNVVIGLQNPDGYTTWFSSSAQPLIKPGESQPYGAVSTFSDITFEREAKEQLAHERNLLRTLTDSIPDYVFVKDTESRFMMVNKTVLNAGGMTEMEQIAGKTDFDFFPSELAQSFYDDEQQLLASGQALVNREEESIDLLTGKKIWFLTTKVPLRDKRGNIVGLIGISRDITERKQLEAQALELAAERQRMNVLNKFMNDISHDFKTPLTVINTSVYLLQKTDDPVRRQKEIEKLETQVSRLTKLFNDFLTVTNLDNAAFLVALQPVDINRLVSMVVNETTSLALQKHHTLSFEPTSNLPMIDGDAISLQQAIANVITNAISYTQDGGRITVKTYEEADHAVIEVQDSGIGIHPDDLSRIFDRLYRADEARSTHTGGSGLGLPIAKQIIEAHEGTLTVESKVGEGSIFRLCLPLSREPVLIY